MEKKEEKKQTKFPIIPIIVIVVIVLVAISCISRFRAKSQLEKALGGKVQVDNSGQTYKIKTKEAETEVSADKSLKWPSDLPVNIPKYDSGAIRSVSHTTEDIWVITVADTDENYFKNYKQTLLAGGWETASEMDFGTSMIILKKGEYQLNAVWDSSSKGALITLSKIEADQ